MLHPFRLASASAALLVTFSVGLGGCAGGAAGDDDLVDADGDAFFGNDPDPARRDCDDLPNHGEQINPGAVEKCDGIDNDCDGELDEDGALGSVEWWPDADADGFGIRVETPKVACELPEGYAANKQDCNDHDATVFPQALERCNGQDDDCDTQKDEGFDPDAIWHADLDEDGFGAEAVAGRGCSTDPSWVRDDSDCNDVNRFVNPDADEICNGVDDDCDSFVDGADEDDLDVLVGARTWYPDTDGDGYGGLIGPYGDGYLIGAIRSCPNEPPADFFVIDHRDCNDFDARQNPETVWYRDADKDGRGDPEVTRGPQCWQPIGWVLTPDDCDDTSPDEWSDRLWYADADRDGYGFGAVPVWKGCRPADVPADAWAADPGDCDDRNAGVHPGAAEICDALGKAGSDLDQDCDLLAGDADPSVTGRTRWFFDHDLDGYGTSFGAIESCRQPSGYAPDPGDCDDNDPSRSPVTLWSRDADRDGYGDPNDPDAVISCAVVPGRVPNAADCNDRDHAQHPGARWWTDEDGDGLGVGVLPAETGCVESRHGLATWTGDCDDHDDADDAGGCYGPQRGTLALTLHADKDAPFSRVRVVCLAATSSLEVLNQEIFLDATDRNKTIERQLGPLGSGSRCTVTVTTVGGDLNGDGPLTVDVASCDTALATVAGDVGLPPQPIASDELLVERCSGCDDPLALNYDPEVIVVLPRDQVCIYP